MKLIVAQTVPSRRLCADQHGSFYANNVRVNGIIPVSDVSIWYLLGVLNAPVADFVFRRIAKPKDAGYFEANRQFIAPIPVPDVPEAARAEVATRAARLQTLHTERRDVLSDIERRMATLRIRPRPEKWLFPDLPDLNDLEARAPSGLDARERQTWAREQRAQASGARYEALGADLRPGVTLDATFERGELRFLVDGVLAVERVFAEADEGAFVLAQWKLVAAGFPITAGTTGKRLADALRRVAVTAPPAVRQQVIALEARLTELERIIAATESEMNAELYRLYGLAEDEIRLVEAG